MTRSPSRRRGRLSVEGNAWKTLPVSDGAGLLVPQKNPAAIAAALRTLLTDRELAAGMTKAAGAAGPELVWAAVAQRYLDLAGDLISARVAA